MLTKKAIKRQKVFLFDLFACTTPAEIDTRLKSATEEQLDLLLALFAAVIGGKIAVPHVARRLFLSAPDIAHLREQFESDTSLQRTLAFQKPVKLALLRNRVNLIPPALQTILRETK